MVPGRAGQCSCWGSVCPCPCWQGWGARAAREGGSAGASIIDVQSRDRQIAATPGMLRTPSAPNAAASAPSSPRSCLITKNPSAAKSLSGGLGPNKAPLALISITDAAGDAWQQRGERLYSPLLQLHLRAPALSAHSSPCPAFVSSAGRVCVSCYNARANGLGWGRVFFLFNFFLLFFLLILVVAGRSSVPPHVAQSGKHQRCQIPNFSSWAPPGANRNLLVTSLG